MGLIGAYERSVGALSEWTTGGKKTAEDAFNAALLKDYAAFLYQTPWYQFPFGEKLKSFWRETPFVTSIRSIERRGSPVFSVSWESDLWDSDYSHQRCCTWRIDARRLLRRLRHMHAAADAPEQAESAL